MTQLAPLPVYVELDAGEKTVSAAEPEGDRTVSDLDTSPSTFGNRA